MPVSLFQRQVATVALRAAARYGFVLGGGNALIMHGIVDRYTADVDLMTNQAEGVRAAASAVEAALRSAGLTADRLQDPGDGLADVFYGFGDGLAEWIVTGPDGQQTLLQITYFERNREPVPMDVGPVLNPEDAIASKVRALVTRAEDRDVLDVAAALERHSVSELIAMARRLEPSLQDEEFAEAGRRIDQLSDARLARSGLTPSDATQLRKRFADWPRS